MSLTTLTLRWWFKPSGTDFSLHAGEEFEIHAQPVEQSAGVWKPPEGLFVRLHCYICITGDE